MFIYIVSKKFKFFWSYIIFIFLENFKVYIVKHFDV